MNTKTKFEWTADGMGKGPTTLSGLISNYRDNFLRKSIEIAPGLTHNQYDVVKRTYFYQHNQFISGPTDENGDPKYFYDLVTDRNDDATKNIDLDTKDAYIKATTQGAYLKSRLLRHEFMAYAKNSGFGSKLNSLAVDLPIFGTVVWKKCKIDGKTDIKAVNLINLMNDPAAEKLIDGPVIERHTLRQSELYKYKAWDQEEIKAMIHSGQSNAKSGFLTTGESVMASSFANQVDEYTPYYDVYEYWGEISKDMYENYKRGGIARVQQRGLPAVQPSRSSIPSSSSLNETVFVMAVVGGIDQGENERVLFCKEVDRDLFPYDEVHFRRRKGRWLGVGNYEMCFDLTEKANEITNRYFASMRIALMHLYQTRDKSYVKNVMTDLLDGDLIVSKSAIETLPTEIRGSGDYINEMKMIEAKADRICKTLEVVTGGSLPSNTPFKLGNQQLQSATKFFEFVQENMGLFIERVFNRWLLPSFSAGLTQEHILDMIDDVEDLEMYFNAKRKIFQYDAIKRHVLKYHQMPQAADIQLIGQLVQDQLMKSPKQVQIERDYYTDLEYSVKMVITGENDRRRENIETLTTLFESSSANPASLQDPRLMKIMNMILEESGYSPLQVNTLNQTQPNPSLNPANQGGAGPGRGGAPSPIQPGQVDPGKQIAAATAGN